MRKLVPLMLVLAPSISFPVYAEPFHSKSYVGGNAVLISYSENTLSSDLSFWSGYARFGAQFDDYVSVEWRVGTGLQSDEVDDADSSAELSLDTMYGAYILGGFPVMQGVYPYVLIGYTRGEMGLSHPATAGERDKTDISFGVGINFSLRNNFAINAEYTRFIKEDGVEISGPAAGFLFYF